MYVFFDTLHMYLHIFDIHMMHMFCIPDTFHVFSSLRSASGSWPVPYVAVAPRRLNPLRVGPADRFADRFW